MRIHYTGRQVEITPRIKLQVEEKLDKVHRLLGRHLDLEAHVILSQERHLHTSEVTLNLKKQPLVVVAAASDFYSSLQEALDNLERQVVRGRQKKRVLQRRSKASRVLTPGGVLESSNGRRAGELPVLPEAEKQKPTPARRMRTSPQRKRA